MVMNGICLSVVYLFIIHEHIILVNTFKDTIESLAAHENVLSQYNPCMFFLVMLIDMFVSLFRAGFVVLESVAPSL